VPWQPDPDRAALLIHDMQRYFVDFFTSGQPPVSELIENAALARATAVRHGMPVIYTAQPGGMTSRERGLLADFWGPGMGTAPDATAIVSELAPAEPDVILTKWRYSAFHQSKLKELLRTWHRDQLIICGIYAHIGCLMTACESFAHDIEPFLVADALADFSLEEHVWCLRYAARRCASVITTATLARMLEAPAPALAQDFR
jgi:bifunctional isochorismate lyase/aryl carrier protein